MAEVISTLRVLSVPPLFDESLALGLLGLTTNHELSAELQLANALASNVIGAKSKYMFVQEPIRTKLRESLYAGDEQFYRLILSRAFSGDGQLRFLQNHLGFHGGHIHHFSGLVASGSQPDAFDKFIGWIRERPNFVPVLCRNSIQTLKQYNFRNDRHTEFLVGLELWNRGKTIQAGVSFNRVLQDPKRDRAAAISMHLLGVTSYRTGDLSSARTILEQGVALQRDLQDQWGLVLTLTSLGRALTEAARRRGAPDEAASAAALLLEAIEIAKRDSIETITASVHVALAKAYMVQGDIASAEASARAATDRAPRGRDAVEARETLATILRESGSSTLVVSQVLEDAYHIAVRDSVAQITLAKLLNVMAASERHAGTLREALEHANESLTIGRLINDDRHVAHSAHTVASVIVDLMERGESLEEMDRVSALLRESESILGRLADSRGIGLVNNTWARFERVGGQRGSGDAVRDESL